MQQAGVDVIIPAGGLPALLFSTIADFKVGDAVVLNPISLLVKITDLSIELKKRGFTVSRAGAFAKASAKGIHEFLATLKTRPDA